MRESSKMTAHFLVRGQIQGCYSVSCGSSGTGETPQETWRRRRESLDQTRTGSPPPRGKGAFWSANQPTLFTRNKVTKGAIKKETKKNESSWFHFGYILMNPLHKALNLWSEDKQENRKENRRSTNHSKVNHFCFRGIEFNNLSIDCLRRRI